MKVSVINVWVGCTWLMTLVVMMDNIFNKTQMTKAFWIVKIDLMEINVNNSVLDYTSV